jgi:hypothetical protein
VEGNAVRIAYEGVNAHAVQVVTMRLADLFIDENRRMGSRLAENTSDFLDGSVADLATKVNELSERVEQIQKAQRTPPRSLMVEYEELQNRYRAMLAKSEDARMAADLEERKTGEQFQVLEPASPGRRVNHDYLTMSLYGAAAGLGLGLALLLVLSLRRGRVSPEPL